MNKIILIGIIILVLLTPMTIAKENNSQGFGEKISFYAKILEKNPNETGITFGQFIKDKIFRHIPLG